MKWVLILFIALTGIVEAQSASSLVRSVRSHTAQLNALEGDLAQHQAKLQELAKEISQTTLNLENAQANLQTQVSDFHVHSRNTLRMAQFPWQAQVVEDLFNNVQARQTIAQQFAKQQTALQIQQREAVQNLLMQHYDLQKKEAAHVTQTQTLLTKRDKLQRSQQQLLKKLGVKNRSLTARLRRALPTAANISIPLQNTPNTKPTPKNAPVTGFIVKDGEKTLSIISTAAAPVQAHEAGRVIFSGIYRDFGQLIILETSPNRYDTYAGLGHRAVQVGDAIKTGQTLGTLPNTTAPVLYFEQRRGDVVLTTKL